MIKSNRQIIIERPDKTTFYLTYGHNKTIYTLKTQISDCEGVPVEAITIYHDLVKLQDTDLYSDIKQQNLNLTMRLDRFVQVRAINDRRFGISIRKSNELTVNEFVEQQIHRDNRTDSKICRIDIKAMTRSSHKCSNRIVETELAELEIRYCHSEDCRSSECYNERVLGYWVNQINRLSENPMYYVVTVTYKDSMYGSILNYFCYDI